MNPKKNIVIVVSVVLIAAVIVGFAYDGIMTAVERASHPQKYVDEVTVAGQKYGVPTEYIYAVIKIESDFDPAAESRADAYGLMQITSVAYFDMTGETATPERMLDTTQNINVGVQYLAYLYSLFGDMDTAIAAYNAGPGNVSDWLSDSRYSSDGKTLTDIPFPETRNYVRRVRDAVNTYIRLYY